MFRCRKGERHQTLTYEGESLFGTTQVKSSLRQNCFACKKGLSYLMGDIDGPSVVLIGSIGEGHQETGISDGLHLSENPLRADRFRGPENDPAKRRKG